MRRVLAVLLLLLGVPLLLAGAVAAALVGPGGTVSSGTHRITTRGSAIVTAGSLLRYVGPTLHVTARPASGHGDVFIGVGHHADVQSYLDGSSYTTVTGFRPPWDVIQDDSTVGGFSPVPRPAGLPFWVASAYGPGPRELSWPTTDGNWNVVLTSTTPSAGQSFDVSVGLTVRYLFEALAAVAAVGLLLCLSGALLLRRRRHRKAGTALPPAPAARPATAAGHGQAGPNAEPVAAAADGRPEPAGGGQAPPWEPAPPPSGAPDEAAETGPLGRIAAESARPEPGDLFRPASDTKKGSPVPAQPAAAGEQAAPAGQPEPAAFAQPPAQQVPAQPVAQAQLSAREDLPVLSEPAVAYPSPAWRSRPRAAVGPEPAPGPAPETAPGAGPEVAPGAGRQAAPGAGVGPGAPPGVSPEAAPVASPGLPRRVRPVAPGSGPQLPRRVRAEAAAGVSPEPSPGARPGSLPGAGPEPEEAGFRAASGWPGRSAPLDPGEPDPGDEGDNGVAPGPWPGAAAQGPQWVPGSGPPSQPAGKWPQETGGAGDQAARRPPEAAHGDEWAPQPPKTAKQRAPRPDRAAPGD